MNEAETRAELIDPMLKQAGWGEVEHTRIRREYQINDGRLQPGGTRGKKDIADYLLMYNNENVGIIEAKQLNLDASEGVAQAKAYADKLQIDYTYATNGKELYEICMSTGQERYIQKYPTPQELWNRIHPEQSDWRDNFNAVPFKDMFGGHKPRYYQEIAVNKVLQAVANKKDRILLTLATGTGKTVIAFQIAWKLFQSRWNLNRDAKRQPRILFLADRNILADQAFNTFAAFPEDALVRIDPKDIRKKGSVPTNGSIFFTIFQTFMSGPGNTPYFGEYAKDFFDCIIIDECHRGGANDESSWRAILEHFSDAVQLGLTATPKRQGNVDTYNYFGEPVYVYSLKEGINDGFLTPFKVKRIQTTLDDYIYTPDDDVLQGEVEEGKVYEEKDFNKTIEIKERESHRVQLMLDEINQNEKAIVFCANQLHAAAVRDLINQMSDSSDPFYCTRVTANDGERGEESLRQFQDNERTIPTILTTSQKLSTGVDARNVRTIVLLREVNSMIEFKQIVGRGTRLYEGKEFFTILDYTNAYEHFLDPEWDGEPIDNTTDPKPKNDDDKNQKNESNNSSGEYTEEEETERPLKIKIKLRDGKEREIQHMIKTSFWSADGKPMSIEEFMNEMNVRIPEFVESEDKLREIWSKPDTRVAFLEKLAEAGFEKNQLETLQKVIDAENSDLFDVLSYVSFASQPISRTNRVEHATKDIYAELEREQIEFIEFVLNKYIDEGVDELAQEKLSQLLTLKYHAIADAEQKLGSIDTIKNIFVGFQKYLYAS